MTRSRNRDRRQPMAATPEGDVSKQPYEAEAEADARMWMKEPGFADESLITDYLANELSPADRERVEDRLRTDPQFRALAEPLIMVWGIPGPLDREPNHADRIAAERSWQKLKKRIEREQHGIHTPTLDEKRRKRRNRRNFVVGAIAALFTVWLEPHVIPIPGLSVQIDAPLYSGERSVNLPDETAMTLVPGSYVTYSRAFLDSTERTVNLDGEATFNMAPGPHGTLVVDGAGVEVKAAEGRFTIHSYKGEPIAYVQVQEGSAEVRPRTLYGLGEILKLRAGDGVRVGPGLHIDRGEAIRLPTARSK